jgi:hypothetical protein
MAHPGNTNPLIGVSMQTDFIPFKQALSEFQCTKPFFYSLKKDGLTFYKLRGKLYLKRTEIESMMTPSLVSTSNQK